MQLPVTLLLAIGKVGLNLAGVGHVADIAEVARAVWNLWNKKPADRRSEVAAVVGADDREFARDVAGVVAEVARDQPESVRESLTTALQRVQVLLRQAQRRPEDPSGRSLRPGLVLNGPEDLIPILTPLLQNQPARFHAGDRPLAGLDWVLVEPLGAGGFGEVWKARQVHDHHGPAVFKFFIDPSARDRFALHEAKVCVRVQKQGRHPGIVALQETYVSADPPCLRYEFIAGGDLGGLIQDWHAQGRKPTPEFVAKALRAIAQPVAFAHRLDPPIVHRDLKPANILIERSNGKIAFKITDFGIGGIAAARAVHAARQVTTPSEFMTTALRGSCTALYASPEQLKDANHVDPRDDVHALGVIWLQMLTGDLTAGRPGGTDWMDELTEQGATPAMVKLLASCFNKEKSRPADAHVLVEKLTELLEPKTQAPPPPAKSVRNSLGMTLVRIEPGTFTMGSTAAQIDQLMKLDPTAQREWFTDELHPHKVRITQPFHLAAHAVTVGQFRRFVADSRYRTEAEQDGKGGYGWVEAEGTWKQDPKFTWLNPGFPQADDHPVVLVSWNDASAFCAWLTKTDGGRFRYRLPTEAEWEYACRAGTATLYPNGDDPERLALIGNVADASLKRKYPNFNTIKADDGYVFTAPVGSYPANAWGLYDMIGNVWEWCQDGFDAEYYKKSPEDDPPGAPGAASRVARGGSWNYVPEFCRSAYRCAGPPESRYFRLGFRLAAVQEF